MRRWLGGAGFSLQRGLQSPALFLLAATPLFANISGTVVNQTTGKPQPSVSVTLIHPGEGGMQTLGTAKSDAEGKFSIDKEVPSPPALLQTDFQGVTYNQILPPGTPTTGVRLNVYDATNKLSADVMQQHLLILEPINGQLRVSETFLIENKGKTTFQDASKGSAQLFLPQGTNTEVTVTAPGGMPIRRPPEKTAQADIYKIGYPLKPGETQFELAYTLPDPKKFAGKAAGSDPLRLVTASTVTLSGDGLKDLGTEPRTQAHVYEIMPGASYVLSIMGEGALRTENAQAQDENSGAPKVAPGMARIYDRLYWILALAFGILALGGTMLYRKGPAA
ncbi:MAG: hypothetical protein JO307_32655 [Bryobacterales bacterium]|nr:hypothetical protein [Bryobacterales bacterium]